MPDGLEQAEGTRLLGGGDGRDVGDGRRRDAGGREPFVPLGRAALSKPVGHERDERVAVPDAVGIRPEALVSRELG